MRKFGTYLKRKVCSLVDLGVSVVREVFNKTLDITLHWESNYHASAIIIEIMQNTQDNVIYGLILLCTLFSINKCIRSFLFEHE